jgi:putative FmdB family regulatory protein
MPIFEYRCDDCDNKFEKLVLRSSDSADLACPSCGQKHLTQELSVFAAHGSGRAEPAQGPPCAGGRCPTPGMCGMNFD